MPDQDRFEKSFASAWKKVLRLSKGGIASDAELSDASITALAHSLRRSGGCPGLQNMAKVLHGFVQNQEDLPSLSAVGGPALTKSFDALRQIERAQGGHRATKVAVRAAMAILVRLSRQNDPHVSESQLAQMLSEQTCLGLVDHHFFGRARAYLCGERFPSFHEVRVWEQTVKKAMSSGIQKLAARLWATLAHADRVSDCLSSESPWETLMKTFPEILEIQEETVRHDGGNPQAIANAYVQMYQTYAAEWARFPLGAHATTM